MRLLGDDEFANLISERERTAGKDHRCQECARWIRKGERYHADVIADESTIHTHRTCLHCMVVRDWLAKQCGGWVYTCVEEDAREHVFQGDGGWPLARAVVAMSKKWELKDGTLRPVPQPLEVF